MHRLIVCFNALFLGIILGLIFLAIFHAPSTTPPRPVILRSEATKDLQLFFSLTRPQHTHRRRNVETKILTEQSRAL